MGPCGTTKNSRTISRWVFWPALTTPNTGCRSSRGASAGRGGRWQWQNACPHHRIAHLIGEHGADPAQILAVTFTNKAAREMKERLELLLAQRLARASTAALGTLPLVEQRQLRSRIYRHQGYVVGTFHACLRGCSATTSTSSRTRKASPGPNSFDLRRGRCPEPEGDCDPGAAAGSQAVRAQKDPLGHQQCQEPGLAAGSAWANAEGQRGKLTADVYRRYRKALAANNALDLMTSCCCQCSCSSRTSRYAVTASPLSACAGG